MIARTMIFLLLIVFLPISVLGFLWECVDSSFIVGRAAYRKLLEASR